MHRSAATLVLALAACGVASEAVCQSFEIKDLHIEKGGTDIDLDNAVFSGRAGNAGNRSGHEQKVNYGVTDWWRLTAAVDWENPVGGDLRATHLGIENIFLLRAMKQKHDIGLGLFVALEASIHDEHTNAFVFGPIVTVKWDKLMWTFNPFLEQTFGRNREDGIALDYAWQAKYELHEGLAVGVEGYGLVENLGDPPRLAEQQHRVGPVLYGEVEVAKNFKIAPSIGVLFGLTSATADVALKLNVDIHLH
jgi:hypothetical protein